jgi:hypothetical protein
MSAYSGGSNSLRTGNLTGNFRGFAAFRPSGHQFPQSFQLVAGQFPEVSRILEILSQFQCVAVEFPEMGGTGNFLGEQGILLQEQGIHFPWRIHGNDVPERVPIGLNRWGAKALFAPCPRGEAPQHTSW